MPLLLILVYPGQVAEFLNVDRKPDAQARAVGYDVFRALDQFAPAACACAVDPERAILFLSFHRSATDSNSMSSRDGHLKNVGLYASQIA